MRGSITFVPVVTALKESSRGQTSWMHIEESRVAAVSECESGNAILMSQALDDPRRMGEHGFTQANVKVSAGSRGIPRCPACHEPDAIEPLQQLDGVWHVRCLNCSCGFTFEAPPPPTAEERRLRADRRTVARSGRRSTDLPRAVTCEGCKSPHVQGWIRTGETLWARCGDCGRVQRVATDVLV